MAEHNTLVADENGQIHLPKGVAVGDLDLVRHGMDLGLNGAGGHSYTIEGYFSAETQPVIEGDGGSRLTPDLVQSFVRSEARFAANEQMTDESPVGHVTEVSGNATVVHADGTSEKISSGTPIMQGDVVETDASGAVNITFSDDSSFAVSENARLAIDDYSFNPETESGSTGVSVLKGVFMFTSGLVGRENPDNVHIDTPVGSIGIRGTIIGGKIAAGAAESQITVLEGAIVVKNGSGEQVLSSQFETVKLTSFNAPITNVGVLEAKAVTQSYGAVRAVSSGLFSSIDDAAGDAPAGSGDAAPANDGADAPAGDGPRSDAAPDGATGNGDAAKADAAPVDAETTSEAQAETDAKADASTTGAEIVETKLTQTTTTITATEPVITLSADVAAPVAAAPAPIAASSTIATAAAVTATSTPAAAPVSAATQVSETTKNTVTIPVTTPAPIVTEPPAVSPVEFKSGGHVLENTAQGHVVGQVGVRDVLNGKVAYTITNDPANLFTINPKTGEVRLKGTAGDFETHDDYHITVRATRLDTGKHSDTDLTIDLRDVNEAPVFTGTGSMTVNENQRFELEFAKVGATDPENENLTYTVVGTSHGKILVGGADAASFTQKDLKDGIVLFVHDGNEPASNTGFTLKATDGAGNTTATRTFSVSVTGINDEPVITEGNNNLTVAQDGERAIGAGALRAVDPDTAPENLVYTVTNSSRGHVQLQDVNNGHWSTVTTFTQKDVNDGLVRFKQDGTIGSDTSATFKVSDGEHLSATHTINYIVEDTDSPATGITLGDNTPIAETASSSRTPVQFFTVNDSDTTAEFRDYTFKIFTKNTSTIDTRFEVVYDEVRESYAVVVKDGKSFDFETAANVNLTVKVYNGTSEAFETSSDLTVNIVNVMDAVTVNGNAMTAEHGLRIYNDVNNPATQQATPAFGMQVRFADTNGDGKADVIIGAPYASSSGNANGIVYNMANTSGTDGHVFASGSTQQHAPTGASPQALMGMSITNVGHFTGDGSDDVAVALTGRGEVRVYSGASNNYLTINSIPLPTVAADVPRSIRVMGIGDFDGDGRDDLLVSTRYAAVDGNPETGRVSIFSGRDFTGAGTTTLSYSSGMGIGGQQGGERFGAAATGLGHVLGEQGDAFAISAPMYDTGSITNRGAIRVFSGGDYDFFTIKGAATDDQLGTQLAGADINGDGLKDIISVAGGNNGGRGTAYVFFTDPEWNGNDFVDVNQMNDSSGKLKGFHISSATQTIGNITSAGDFNGDGYEDVLLNAYTFNSTTKVYSHNVYVVYGKQNTTDIVLDTLSATQGLKIGIPDAMRLYQGEDANGANLSLSLDGGADYNGDGYDDILIGTAGANDDADLGREGGAYIIYGGNYDSRTSSVTGTSEYVVDAAARSLVGNAENNTIRTNFAGTSMRGGAGNDIFIVEGNANTNTPIFKTNIRMVDGGSGHDILKLMEMDPTTGTQNDTIDLRGLSQKISSIEEISLNSSRGATGAGEDKYNLTIGDVLSMLDDVGTLKITSSNNSSKLVLKQTDLTSNLGTVGNFLIGSGTSGFTQDTNSDGTHDTKSEGGKTFYVYTHQETGHQLLVQNTIANADGLNI